MAGTPLRPESAASRSSTVPALVILRAGRPARAAGRSGGDYAAPPSASSIVRPSALSAMIGVSKYCTTGSLP